MAKFSNVRMTNVSNTKCPGTDVYMPPEAVVEPVVYTANGDVFSFGVNMIQMLTRKSPLPGNRHKPFVNTVPNKKPTLLSGTIEVRVPEVERRDNHIKEISSAHPLFPVALDCLKDQEEDRPSAGQVYLRLSSLKDTPGYIMSEVARHIIQQPSVPRQVRSQRSEAKDHVKVKRDVKSLNWKVGEDAPSVMKRDANAVVSGSVAYFRAYGVWTDSTHIFAFDSSTDTWTSLPDCPSQLTTLATVNGLLTTVGGKRSNKLFSLTGAAAQGNHKWTKVFPPMPTERHNVTAVTTDSALIVAGGEAYGLIQDTTLKTIEIMNIDTRQWSKAADLAQPMYRASATICGNHIYFLGGWETFTSHPLSVLKCSVSALIQSTAAPQHGLWSEINDLSTTLSTCVTFHDHLLAIGGRESDVHSTAAVHLFDPVNHSWKVVGYMSSPRHMCFVVSLPDDRLMVAGGETGLYPYFSIPYSFRLLPDILQLQCIFILFSRYYCTCII